MTQLVSHPFGTGYITIDNTGLSLLKSEVINEKYCNIKFIFFFLFKLTLPLTNSPLGSELTLEPFRWDQRFFAIIFNIHSIPSHDQNFQSFIPHASLSPVNAMCEVTGGKFFN